MDFDLEKSIEVLERTPDVLRAILAGLSDGWTHSNYGEKTFSPFDVVGHLIHADDMEMGRVRFILEREESEVFPPFDRYTMYETSKGKLIGELLDTFAELRANHLDELRAMKITSAMLSRKGKHPQFGIVTLSQLLAAWVVHDLGHTHQIVKSMAFQYRDAVGPWREFLTILPK